MRLFQMLLAFVIATSLTAQTKVSFAFTGELKIERAEYYFDGGSVSVVLLDSKGNRGYVHYTPKSRTNSPKRGRLTFRHKSKEKGITLARGSDDEKQLLKYLREACITSFGTSDPKLLKEGASNPKGPNARGDFWIRMPMGKLLSKFPQNQPEEDYEKEIRKILTIRRETLISDGLGEAHPNVVKIDKLIKLLNEPASKKQQAEQVAAPDR